MTYHGPDLLDVDGRNPAIQEFRDMFGSSYLPAGLPRQVAVTFHMQAQALLNMLPDTPLLTRALHRLWESKNEAVMLAVKQQRKLDQDRADD